ITLVVNGEPESAKLILRDLVNATVGFEALAEEIRKPAKRVHRMLSWIRQTGCIVLLGSSMKQRAYAQCSEHQHHRRATWCVQHP
ncbi:MAG: hypothetical protein RL539_789, partial [Pseudomonadota bacterium]